jgi:hypothetical protein
VSKPGLSDWQRRVLADLDAIVEAFPGDVQLLGGQRLERSGSMRLRLRLRTADIPRAGAGMTLGAYEEFTVLVGRTELVPPRVEVDHLRFLHHAHVMQGTRLCLYMDPSREWDPINGFGCFVDRLFDWLGDAAGGRFNAQTALYHAVGGVLHLTEGAPTIVMRDALDPGKRVQPGLLVARALRRFDLTLNATDSSEDGEHVPVITLNTDLPLGAGSTLAGFLWAVADPYAAHSTFGREVFGARADTAAAAMALTALGASAIRKPDGAQQHLVIAVPHPTGGPPHLLAACIPPAGADRLRALVVSSRKKGSSFIDMDPAQVNADTALEWWPVSDEREAVTTRRDSTRPVAAYIGKTVHVWGCGGLGSWIAEYVVRAGAKAVVLCDPGAVSGGLLVRQNFVEADIGNAKVEALAQRLRAISDTVRLTVHAATVPGAESLVGADLIIDATISVAIGRYLDAIATNTFTARPVLAQVATDARTGTLGILTVSMAPLPQGPLTIDRAAGDRITKEGAHEAFRTLWDNTATGDEIIPTRGCSAPTFHGSAADLAGVAASLTSILGGHLSAGTTLSGTHLISLPHGEAGPLRAFLPAPQTPANTEPISAEPDSVEGAA